MLNTFCCKTCLGSLASISPKKKTVLDGPCTQIHAYVRLDHSDSYMASPERSYVYRGPERAAVAEAKNDPWIDSSVVFHIHESAPAGCPFRCMHQLDGSMNGGRPGN